MSIARNSAAPFVSIERRRANAGKAGAAASASMVESTVCARIVGGAAFASMEE
jgi:hypothetical protein